MRRRTSAVAILASALSLLTMIWSIKTIDDKEDEINHLVDVHYQFADDVLTLLECEWKEACSAQMKLIINHLEKLYK